MAEVSRLVLEAVLLERRWRLMMVDGVLLVVVVLEGILLLHEVLVLLVELLVIVQILVRVRRWPRQEGLRLQRLLGQIGHNRMVLQAVGRRDGRHCCCSRRRVRPAIVLRRGVAGTVVVVGAAAAAVGGESGQMIGMAALLALVVVLVKGMEVVIGVGIPVPVPPVRLVEGHALEGGDGLGVVEMLQLLLGVGLCVATRVLLDRESGQVLRQLLLAPILRHGRGHHEFVGGDRGDSSHRGAAASGPARPILGVQKGLKLSLRYEVVVTYSNASCSYTQT